MKALLQQAKLVQRIHGPWLNASVDQPKGPWDAQLLAARTLLGAKGIATRSKDATRGSWTYY